MSGSYRKGVIYTLISAVNLSLIALFAKITSLHFGLITQLFWRFLLSLLFCLPWLFLLKGYKTLFPVKKRSLHVIRALFVMSAQYSFFYYLTNTNLLNATVLLNTGPLFIPLIERTLFARKIGKSTIVSLIVGFIGILCILQPGTGIFSFLSLIGLIAGLSQGFSQVLFGRSSKDEKPENSTFLLFLLCTLMSAVPYLFLRSGESIVTDNLFSVSLISLILLGVVSVANQIFRGFAYREGNPSTLAPFLYVSVVISGLIDALLFKNVPNFLSIIGGFLVVLAAVLKIYLRNRIIKNR